MKSRLLALTCTILLVPPAFAGDVLIAHEVQTYSSTMKMPTDVAVGPDGQVFVADGVNDRVVEFDSRGSVKRSIRKVAGQRLSRPTALATSNDSLWIADADHHRVVALDFSGGGERTIALDPSWQSEIDLTGLAISPQASQIWLVDNDNHRLLEGDLRRGTWTKLGSLGDAFGQFRYPAMVARSKKGDAYVSDALNGRIQSFTASGRPVKPISRYGVTPGTLYRPRGVAVYDEQLWVAGAPGVLQVFTTNGSLVDVVKNDKGRILRLDKPAGIAKIEDRLYVVELGANRVREFRIEVAPGDPFSTVGPRATGKGDSEGRECTVCHLELVPELVDGGSTSLVRAPENSDERPYASAEETCLSCHDGTVLDSRKNVWVRHGHPTGMEPSKDMVIPEELPLEDGTITCRTCHSAHTLGGAGAQHRDALMLRVAEMPGELCMACHGDMKGTP